jgi:phage terminase large subunit
LPALTPTKARQILEGIEANPSKFCSDILGFPAWSKQKQILESVRENERTAVRSCHGAGKTAIAARAALWFLAAHPRSTVITTAPTWPQVKEQLWREIASGYQAAGGFFDGTLSQTELELGPDWFALGLSTDKPERFQGYHAEHILLVVDEASGVDERIFEAGEGFLTAEGARILLIGNPTQLSGQFYRAFHAEALLWNRISISALETPAFTGEEVSPETLRRLVTPEWVEDKKRKWGESSALYAIRVLGEFPREADDSVCSVADVEAAQIRELEPALPIVVSCDVARFGSDDTVIAVRRGNQVRIAQVAHGRDTMEVAGLITRVAADNFGGATIPHLVVDDPGVGGGVVDRLRELASFPVHDFIGAQRARVPTDYPNKRSESWFAFADRLGEVDLDPDPQLLEDLVAPLYKVDSQGRRVVEAKDETKKRLGRSPDRADAVLMAFSFSPLEVEKREEIPATAKRALSAGIMERQF